jgi:hypothetical protein
MSLYSRFRAPNLPTEKRMNKKGKEKKEKKRKGKMYKN